MPPAAFAAPFAAVSAFGHHQLVIVARKLQSRRQILIGQRPVAVQVVQVVAAVLQVHLDGLRLAFRLANESGIHPAAANVRKAADVAQHLAELFRLLPRRGEGTDSTGRDSTDRPIGGIFRDVQPLKCDGQEFIDEKVCISVARRVVFKRAIAAGFGTGNCRGNRSRIHEHGNRDRHRFLMNQIVEHHGNAKRSLGVRITGSVHEHHQRGGFFGLVLGRHIHAVVADGPGENPAVFELPRREFSMRNTRLDHAIRILCRRWPEQPAKTKRSTARSNVACEDSWGELQVDCLVIASGIKTLLREVGRASLV